jgi:hypothetical protein
MRQPLLLVLALVVAGCAAPGAVAPDAPYASATTSAGSLRPLVIGWQQFFTVDWQSAERRGRPIVQGRIYNNWGLAASDVRLLVNGLDPAGQVVEQRVAWLGTLLTPGTTAPFEVALQRPASAYRVEVFSFDWVQADGQSTPR